jgi:membrane protein YdbS with pleckstrin-like domain
MSTESFAPPGATARFLDPLLKLPEGPPPLPAGAREARTFRAARQYLKYRYAKVAIGGAIAVPEIIALTGGSLALHWLLAVILFAFAAIAFTAIVIITVAVIRLEYDLRQYVVTDKTIRIRSGAVVVSEATITFANVQDVEISQGPLQRWFGIADLIVHTAGGSAPSQKGGHGNVSHRGLIAGIERPAELRDFILERLRIYRDSGLGDVDDPTRAVHGSTPATPEDHSTWQEALADLRSATEELRRAVANPS